MTLENLMHNVGEIAISNKVVNWFGGGGSIYELNALDIKDYALIYLSPTGTHNATNNYTEYNITLFYMDRLLDDNSNDVQIYSAGIEILKRIIKDISEMDGVLDVSERYTIENFTETERMSDRCAGAFATVTITVSNNTNC